MTGSYTKARRELAEQTADPSLKCRYCGAATEWETLSHLGARCRPCFDAYCREGIQPRPQAQSALPRTPGRVNVLPSGEPRSAGPEHAMHSLPLGE